MTGGASSGTSVKLKVLAVEGAGGWEAGANIMRDVCWAGMEAQVPRARSAASASLFIWQSLGADPTSGLATVITVNKRRGVCLWRFANGKQ